MPGMTPEECAEIYAKIDVLEKQGNIEQAKALYRTIPLPPSMAKTIVEFFGAEKLLSFGGNLSEVEATYGKDWLSKYKA